MTTTPDANGSSAETVPATPQEPAQPVIPSDEERLALYIQAERAILLGHQAYAIEGLSYTRADLGKIQGMIATLRARIEARQAETSGRAGWGGVRTVGVRF